MGYDIVDHNNAVNVIDFVEVNDAVDVNDVVYVNDVNDDVDVDDINEIVNVNDVVGVVVAANVPIVPELPVLLMLSILHPFKKLKHSTLIIHFLFQDWFREPDFWSWWNCAGMSRRRLASVFTIYDWPDKLECLFLLW